MYQVLPDGTPGDVNLLAVSTLLPRGRDAQGETKAVCELGALRLQLPAAIETAVEVMKTEAALRAALDGLMAGSYTSARRLVAGYRPDGSLDALDPRKIFQDNLTDAVAELRVYVAKVADAADAVISLAARLLPDQLRECGLESTVATPGRKAKATANEVRGINAPSAFENSLTLESAGQKLANGQVFAFGATPAELAQRLSTTASTATSMQLALTLSGKKTEMVRGQLDSGYMEGIGQTAAMLERLPLVVGFSDRTEPAKIGGKLEPADEVSKPTPKFGWVFGPKGRFDVARKRFIFEQAVGSYDVAADISLPSWWPRVELKVDTAWIANWHEASVLKRVKDTKSPRLITFDLPVNRADLDGLTRFLLKDIRRATETTAIAFVEPAAISACANDVTILIYGANVWRNAEVYLGGIRSTEIKVLPDMEGIAAKFELAEFYKNTNAPIVNGRGFEEAILSVNTRNGNAFRVIRIVGERNPAAVKDKKDAPTMPVSCKSPHSIAGPILRDQHSLKPSILAIYPPAPCGAETRFVLTGRNLRGSPRVFLNGQEGRAKEVGAVSKLDDLHVIVVTFDKPFLQKADKGELIVMNETGFAAMSLGACDGTRAELEHRPR